MAKLKKRVHKKKAVIKKRVHRTNNHNQSHNAKTSEQQSRDNEMLKVMLGRPQQVIPGQVQQNDKLQQQIDTANKALNDIIQDNNSLKDQYRRIKEQQQEHLHERRQTTADIRTEEKMLDEDERHFHDMEKLGERREELENRKRDLEKRKATVKGETEIGAINAQIEDIKHRERELDDEIKARRDEMERNRAYNMLEEVKRGVQDKADELRALNNIMASAAYKNPNEALIREYTNKLLKEREIKHKRQIMEIQDGIADANAQAQAYKNYVTELEKPTPIVHQVLNKGTPEEKIVYKKSEFGPSLKEQYESQLAEQIKQKAEHDQELYKQQKQFDNAANLQKQLVDQR